MSAKARGELLFVKASQPSPTHPPGDRLKLSPTSTVARHYVEKGPRKIPAYGDHPASSQDGPEAAGRRQRWQ
eukprot:3404876-Amphidinium_carterae.1